MTLLQGVKKLLKYNNRFHFIKVLQKIRDRERDGYSGLGYQGWTTSSRLKRKWLEVRLHNKMTFPTAKRA